MLFVLNRTDQILGVALRDKPYRMRLLDQEPPFQSTILH